MVTMIVAAEMRGFVLIKSKLHFKKSLKIAMYG